MPAGNNGTWLATSNYHISKMEGVVDTFSDVEVVDMDTRARRVDWSISGAVEEDVRKT